jgi:hypothetical protein
MMGYFSINSPENSGKLQFPVFCRKFFIGQSLSFIGKGVIFPENSGQTFQLELKGGYMVSREDGRGIRRSISGSYPGGGAMFFPVIPNRGVKCILIST